MADLISLKKIKRHYDVGGEVVRALDGVDLTINQNEYISIMGPSGSGKSTLMNMIGCLAVSYTHLTLPTIYSV